MNSKWSSTIKSGSVCVDRDDFFFCVGISHRQWKHTFLRQICALTMATLFCPICVTWRIHVCGVTHSWLIHMYDLSDPHVWRESFTRVTPLARWHWPLCDMTFFFFWGGFNQYAQIPDWNLSLLIRIWASTLKSEPTDWSLSLLIKIWSHSLKNLISRPRF